MSDKPNQSSQQYEENQKNLERNKNANYLGEINFLISSILNSKDIDEVARLKKHAMSLAGQMGDTGLISSISEAATKAAEEIKEDLAKAEQNLNNSIKEQESVDPASILPVSDIIPEIIPSVVGEMSKEMSDNFAKLNSKESILDLVKTQFSEKQDNVYDTAYGGSLKAIEEQERKTEHRLHSKERLSGLQELGENLSKFDSLDESEKNDFLAKAKDHNIKVELDNNGKIKDQDKLSKMFNSVSSQDKEVIAAKQTERKAEDGKDHLGEALASGPINLFGSIDEDDFTSPAAQASKSPHTTAKDLANKMKDSLSNQSREKKQLSNVAEIKKIGKALEVSVSPASTPHVRKQVTKEEGVNIMDYYKSK